MLIVSESALPQTAAALSVNETTAAPYPRTCDTLEPSVQAAQASRRSRGSAELPGDGLMQLRLICSRWTNSTR